MRFRPELKLHEMDDLTKLAVAQGAKDFENSVAGQMHVEAITSARDAAMNVLLRHGIDERSADYARGALDVLNGLLDHGIAEHRKIRESLELPE